MYIDIYIYIIYIYIYLYIHIIYMMAKTQKTEMIEIIQSCKHKHLIKCTKPRAFSFNHPSLRHHLKLHSNPGSNDGSNPRVCGVQRLFVILHLGFLKTFEACSKILQTFFSVAWTDGVDPRQQHPSKYTTLWQSVSSDYLNDCSTGTWGCIGWNIFQKHTYIYI